MKKIGFTFPIWWFPFIHYQTFIEYLQCVRKWARCSPWSNTWGRSLPIWSSQSCMEGTTLTVHQQMKGQKKCGTFFNGILFSHKKEQNWVICSDAHESRVCCTEWSMTEKNKYHIYEEKWYRWTYLKNRNRHRYREQMSEHRARWRGWDKLRG